LDFQFCPFDGERLEARPGRNEGRPSCTRCRFVHYANPVPAVAVFIKRGTEVLLVRRAIEPEKGKWDIPGGFVQWDEKVEQTVVRECEEELSVIVDDIKFLGSIPDVYGPFKTQTINLCFLAAITCGELFPASDVDRLEWFSVDRPPALAFAHQQQAIALLREYIAKTSANQQRGLPTNRV